jgi:hypothetical protein
LEARVAAGDIDPSELILAGVEIAGVNTQKGVKAACAKAVEVITAKLNHKG